MATMRVGDAVSLGISLGLGLALTNHMFQTVKPFERTAKPLIVCLKCQDRNPLENKFCWQCGSALSRLDNSLQQLQSHRAFDETLWKLRFSTREIETKRKEEDIRG